MQSAASCSQRLSARSPWLPEVAGRLRQRIQDYLARTPAWESGALVVEIDHMERNQLRALGYAIP